MMNKFLTYPQIFYSLVFLSPFLSFVVAFFKSPASLNNFIYLYPSIHLFISSNRNIFRIGVYFFSISAIIVTNDFNKFINNLFKKNANKKTTLYTFLLYVQTISTYLFVMGILGMITYPENNAIIFTFIMEIIFFINILIFLIIYDKMIKLMKERINLGIYLYDTLMVLAIFSFLALRIFATIHNIEDLFPIVSINEHISFFLCLLKFPINGIELQTIKINTEKFE